MTTSTLPAADTRKARLTTAVQREVVSGGRIEMQNDYGAVVRYGTRTNHVLHLILTLITGIWAIIWIALSIDSYCSQATVMLAADEQGTISREVVKNPSLTWVWSLILTILGCVTLVVGFVVNQALGTIVCLLLAAALFAGAYWIYRRSK